MSAAAPRLLSTPLERLIERVDVADLQLLEDNLDLLPVGTRKIVAEYTARSLSSGGVTQVVYRQKKFTDETKTTGVGRYAPDGSLSLATFPRAVRSLLARRQCIDIDMRNAHPEILLNIAERFGWEAPVLSYYVKNREAALAEFDCDRRTAKTLMLAMMFGNNIYEEVRNRELNMQLPAFVEPYRAELASLAGLICRQFPLFRKMAEEDETNTNTVFIALSLFLQDQECKALAVAVNVARDRGWVPAVLMHDGFMVYRNSDDETSTIPPGLLNLMWQRVKQELGINLRFETKAFDEPLVTRPLLDRMWDSFR